jgi:hypothetical protein
VSWAGKLPDKALLVQRRPSLCVSLGYGHPCHLALCPHDRRPLLVLTESHFPHRVNRPSQVDDAALTFPPPPNARRAREPLKTFTPNTCKLYHDSHIWSVRAPGHCHWGRSVLFREVGHTSLSSASEALRSGSCNCNLSQGLKYLREAYSRLHLPCAPSLIREFDPGIHSIGAPAVHDGLVD